MTLRARQKTQGIGRESLKGGKKSTSKGLEDSQRDNVCCAALRVVVGAWRLRIKNI